MKVREIASRLHEIYDDISTNVTHIYEREDAHLGVDLVYHSVLRFKFRGQWVNKGWCEFLLFGDTREGKTAIVKSMLNHYKLGEFCEGEATSFAGLVGGIQNVGRQQMIHWGRIPLNDERLIAIDEVSGMPIEQLALFSGIRSSGVAQITKILTEKTFARTRLIWMSNPRSGRKLETYNYGVWAVKELMGKAEDISRLDFALTVASGEVDQRTINRGLDKQVPHKLTSEACHNLVKWAWTREPKHIEITPDAEEAVLDAAERLGSKYSVQIPLVQPAEQRIKLARMSVALAARLFSTDDGERVVVYPAHVEYIEQWLNEIYTKPSMGYDAFSRRGISNIKTEASKQMLDEYRRKAHTTPLTHVLLGAALVRRTMMEDMLGWSKDEAVDFISWGVQQGLLVMANKGMVKTPAFTELLKKVQAIEEREQGEGITYAPDPDDDQLPY